MEQKKEEPAVVEHKEEKKEQSMDYSEGMPISGFVKQDIVSQLVDLGFSKIASEKALYLTGNDSIDKAMDWIEKHQQDTDFEEELRIVGYIF